MINCAHPTHFAGAVADGGPWSERIQGLRANASTLSHAELDEAEDIDDGDPGDLAARHGAVGRFLEHSRIYYFDNAGKPEVFLASADWMPRNFVRRVEIAFPIEDPGLRDEIINEVLPSFLNDHIKARELQSDGTYLRLKPTEGEPRSQAQLHFRERFRRQARKLAESQPAAVTKLTPITVAGKQTS